MLLRLPNCNQKHPHKTYSLLIDTYIKDPTEKLHLLHASKQCRAFNAKPTGISNGATPPMPGFPNKYLHLLLSKASSSQALSAPYSGSIDADSCLASVSATN
jgi:hypothetical protein